MSVFRTVVIVAVLGAAAGPVRGGGPDRVPPGNVAVWVFLGFCALIIVAQLLPLVRMTARRLRERVAKKEAVEQAPER